MILFVSLRRAAAAARPAVALNTRRTPDGQAHETARRNRAHQPGIVSCRRIPAPGNGRTAGARDPRVRGRTSYTSPTPPISPCARDSPRACRRDNPLPFRPVRPVRKRQTPRAWREPGLAGLLAGALAIAAAHRAVAITPRGIALCSTHTRRSNSGMDRGCHGRLQSRPLTICKPNRGRTDTVEERCNFGLRQTKRFRCVVSDTGFL